MKVWQIMLLVYLCGINLVAFGVSAWDKHCAKKQRRRVPERTLLLLSAVGGSPLFLASMYLLHHKTRKPKFFIGVPVILVLQIALVVVTVTQGWLA